MQCNDYRDAIQELADGALGPIRRAELQVHLDSCPRCRALAADMRRIRDLARSLDPMQPPDAVWLQIAGRLRQQGRIAAPSAAEQRSHRRRIAALAIAAALVVAIGASIFTLLPRQSVPGSTAPPQQTSNAPASDPVQDFANEIRLAEQHYQNAIAKLEEAAKSDQDLLDPQTAAVVKNSLQTIDQAIEESRKALRLAPESAPARESLFDALKRKVGVLQETIATLNQIRKGAPAVDGEAGRGS